MLSVSGVPTFTIFFFKRVKRSSYMLFLPPIDLFNLASTQSILLQPTNVVILQTLVWLSTTVIRRRKCTFLTVSGSPCLALLVICLSTRIWVASNLVVMTSSPWVTSLCISCAVDCHGKVFVPPRTSRNMRRSARRSRAPRLRSSARDSQVSQPLPPVAHSRLKPPRCPEEFAIYMNYVRKLGFEETPDYDFLRELFTKVLKTLGEPEDGVFDWMLLNGGKGWEASHVRPYRHAHNGFPEGFSRPLPFWRRLMVAPLIPRIGIATGTANGRIGHHATSSRRVPHHRRPWFWPLRLRTSRTHVVHTMPHAEVHASTLVSNHWHRRVDARAKHRAARSVIVDWSPRTRMRHRGAQAATARIRTEGSLLSRRTGRRRMDLVRCSSTRTTRSRLCTDKAQASPAPRAGRGRRPRAPDRRG